MFKPFMLDCNVHEVQHSRFTSYADTQENILLLKSSEKWAEDFSGTNKMQAEYLLGIKKKLLHRILDT